MLSYRNPLLRLVLLWFLISASTQVKGAQGAFLSVAGSYGSSSTSDDADAVGAEGPLQPLIGSIKNKYERLTPKGRFIAMAATGFIGSRLVMDVAATTLKLAGAVFIVAEVLHYTGALDDLPSLSGEQRNFLEQAQGEVLRRTDAFRVQVRRRLNPQSVQAWIDQDRLGALGLAAGSFFGTIL